MRRVLVDAWVPHWLGHELPDVDVETAWFAGLAEETDAELLNAIEGDYEILEAPDRDLSYQQRVAGRLIAVVVVRVPDQTPAAFRALAPQLRAALKSVKEGTVILVGV